jgi:hypothetical protein
LHLARPILAFYGQARREADIRPDECLLLDGMTRQRAGGTGHGWDCSMSRDVVASRLPLLDTLRAALLFARDPIAMMSWLVERHSAS